MSPRLALATLVLGTVLVLPAAGETRTYDVADFDAIDVSAGIEVTFETGVPTSVIVENEDGDFDDIIVESKNGTLTLKRPRRMGWGRGQRDSYSVSVGTERLSEIEASSGSRVTGNGLSSNGLTLDVSSGAEMTIGGIVAGKVTTSASSGSRMELEGTCDTMVADASSGLSIAASDFICNALEADVSSGASIRAHASDRVDAEASSGGSVRVKGAPANVTTDKSSGGSVRVTG